MQADVDQFRSFEKAQAAYAARRKRSEVFGEFDTLFGEPAWDILLDLFVARRDGRDISVTSACMAGCCPPTTGLRHLASLETCGLVERVPDAADGRRFNVRLTSTAIDLIERALG